MSGSPLQVIDSIVQFTDGTQAAWNSILIPIPAGLLIYATDTTVIKRGDGTTLYSALPVLLQLNTITALPGQITTINDAITNLANVNGSNTEVFNVATATTSNEAVNLGQVENLFSTFTGSSTNVFQVAPATGPTDAVPLGQAETLFMPKRALQAVGLFGGTSTATSFDTDLNLTNDNGNSIILVTTYISWTNGSTGGWATCDISAGLNSDVVQIAALGQSVNSADSSNLAGYSFLISVAANASVALTFTTEALDNLGDFALAGTALLIPTV